MSEHISKEREDLEKAFENYSVDELTDEKYDLGLARVKPSSLLAHYTSIENFYNIIDTDGLWATQARFSNDYEELRYAAKELGLLEDTELPDAYIVSLCLHDDNLGQWRGYTGGEEGIAISFDFSDWRQFCLSRKNKDNIIYSEPFYICPVQIFYADKCKLSKSNLLNDLKLYSMSLNKFVPYIKHPLFHDEIEYRLAVINENGLYSPFIRHRKSGHNQIPFVEIKSGEHHKQNRPCVIRVNTDANIYVDIKKTIEKEFNSKEYIIVNCRNQQNTEDDKHCFGCSMRYYLNNQNDADFAKCSYCIPSYISPTANIISISECGDKQRDTFFDIASIVDKLNRDIPSPNIKVWCEGHLPIRQLRVGNTRRKEELCEIIQHFCLYSEYYWLRYVKVDVTNVPLRPRLEFD